MAKEEKSTFQIPSLLLSSFISNIYTPEKGYHWQNQPNSLKGKGVSRSQLQCRATALRKNCVHLNRATVIEINVCVCEVREGNFDDKVRVTWILVRTSTEPQRGQNKDQGEH